LEAARTAFSTLKCRTFDVTLVKEIPKRLEQKLPIDDLLQGINADKFLDVYLKAYYRATATKTRLMPNVAETLERLSGKAKLALITMRHVPKKKIIEELESLGIAKYFAYVVTALDTHNPKPSPEAYAKCSEHLNVEGCECAVVGDSVADIRAGKAAGAKTVAVLSGLFSFEELENEKPDLILESVEELPAFLE
jgi:HAD superfamily hydrolase (TIGR01509 family)